MSYMKNHLIFQAEQAAIAGRLYDDLIACERNAARVRVERLAWEAKRAVNDYLEALAEYQRLTDDDAGRRADEAIESGITPF